MIPDGRVVLSDLDGVLVDSAASVSRVWAWWAAQHGLDAAAVEAQAHGRRSVETIRAVAPRLDAQAESRRVELHQARDVSDLTAIPGAAALLRDAPAGRIAVVTSGSDVLARARLGAVGLPVPGVFVTDEQVARGKPDPEGYDTAARRLGAAPEACVVLEDAPAGVAAGLAAGMGVIGVLTSHSPEALAGAHTHVADLRGIGDVIARLG